MKKTILTALVVALLLGPAVTWAAFSGPGAGGQSVTVSQLSNLQDDAMVTLTGQIIRQLGDDKYEFKDKTGTVTVEIDHKVWQGMDVNPQKTVTIYGELDKDFTRIKVDVKRISLQ